MEFFADCQMTQRQLDEARQRREKRGGGGYAYAVPRLSSLPPENSEGCCRRRPGSFRPRCCSIWDSRQAGRVVPTLPDKERYCETMGALMRFVERTPCRCEAAPRGRMHLLSPLDCKIISPRDCATPRNGLLLVPDMDPIQKIADEIAETVAEGLRSSLRKMSFNDIASLISGNGGAVKGKPGPKKKGTKEEKPAKADKKGAKADKKGARVRSTPEEIEDGKKRIVEFLEANPGGNGVSKILKGVDVRENLVPRLLSQMKEDKTIIKVGDKRQTVYFMPDDPAIDAASTKSSDEEASETEEAAELQDQPRIGRHWFSRTMNAPNQFGAFFFSSIDLGQIPCYVHRAMSSKGRYDKIIAEASETICQDTIRRLSSHRDKRVRRAAWANPAIADDDLKEALKLPSPEAWANPKTLLEACSCDSPVVGSFPWHLLATFYLGIPGNSQSHRWTQDGINNLHSLLSMAVASDDAPVSQQPDPKDHTKLSIVSDMVRYKGGLTDKFRDALFLQACDSISSFLERVLIDKDVVPHDLLICVKGDEVRPLISWIRRGGPPTGHQPRFDPHDLEVVMWKSLLSFLGERGSHGDRGLRKVFMDLGYFIKMQVSSASNSKRSVTFRAECVRQVNQLIFDEFERNFEEIPRYTIEDLVFDRKAKDQSEEEVVYL